MSTQTKKNMLRPEGTASEKTRRGALLVANRAILPTTPVTRILKMKMIRMEV